MRKLLFFLMAMCCQVATFNVCAENGDIFNDGKFQYQIISENPHQVQVKGLVTNEDNDEEFEYLNEESGNDLVIPAQVDYNGNSYSITVIGESALSGEKISSITFPETLVLIEERAFAYNNITELNLPSSLEKIERYAFNNCPIETLYINSNVFLYDHTDEALSTPSCFNDSSIPHYDLTTLIINEGVTSMPSFSFSYKLKNVFLPSSLESISEFAFKYCIALETVVLPNNISSLERSAFYGCTNLSSITIPSSVKYIGGGVFAECKNLSYIELPEDLISIESGLFQGSGLKSFSFPTNIKTIGYGAFLNTQLESIELPESLETIGIYAFANTKITNLVLPENLKQINNEAFYGCLIETLTINSRDLNLERDALSFNNLTTLTFGAEVNSIPSFSGAELLTEVALPAKLSSIPDNAFRNCIALQSVIIPDNLNSIGEYAFYGCQSLLKIKLPDTVSKIGSFAFADCSNFKSFIIPEELKEIPEGMLQNCDLIKEILVPNTVTSIGQNAFQGCTSLSNIDLGTGLYSIGDYAFADCDNITDIHSMALNPPYAEQYTFPIPAYTNATVTVREQSLATYNRENPWYRFQNYLTVPGAISLSHYNVDMAGNEVFQLGVYGSDSKIEWTSSNPSVAYANECGLIVAMGITGATVITAHVDGEEINCNVTVSSPYRDPQAYTRAGEDEDLQPVDVIMEGVGGNPPMVNVRLVPVGSKTIIDWTSSDSALATVNNGLVTVYADGEVDFGVETENGIEEYVEVDTQNIEQSGVEEIYAEGDIIQHLNVYDISGRIILFNATIEQIKLLDKGIYIIKGKKVLIK